MVINIKGNISSNSERREIDRVLMKDKKYSSRPIPDDPDTGFPVFKMNCLGYRDDMLGLGEWAKNQVIDVAGEIHKTHWFTGELVNIDLEDDVWRLARIAPSANLVILVGSPYGGLNAEWILRVVGGKVKRYVCYGENKMRWLTEEEVWNRVRPIVESMISKSRKGE